MTFPFPSQFNLSELNGNNGFVINGIATNDNSGRSVSGAGDINGDGIDDLIIGAPGANPRRNFGAGESYVVFGSTQGFAASLNLSTLDGLNGFVLNGINRGDNSGYSVSGAGDINGDGFDDLIIGARDNAPDGDRSGASYVVFGSDQGFSSRVNLADLDGRNGFILNGIDEVDRSGRSVSGAGDINGDGFDDLIIGAAYAGSNGSAYVGESYVVFGSDQDFAASLNLADLDGRNGFVLNGIDAEDFSGFSLSGAGDINGDGFDDLIIGALGADPNSDYSGKSYAVFGSNQDFAASLDLSDLDGSNGFVLNGIDERDNSGISVSGAGDINGDGIDDLIIGADGAGPNDNNSGESYVVFGSSQGFATSLDLSDLDGRNGFVLNGIDERDFSGSSVSGVGDINGDGIDDLIISAGGADPNGESSGESYVVFGNTQGFAAILNLADLDGRNGFVLNGIDAEDFSGGSVSGAGDINGDGIDDLIIGARFADPNGNSLAGESYVVFGRQTPTPEDDVLFGTVERDVIFALAGNDWVSGRGGNDRLAGQAGNDQLSGGSGNDALTGGVGNDRLLGGTGADRLSGNAGNDRLVGGDGTDNLLGGIGDDTLFGRAGNDTLRGGSGNDQLRGSVGDDLLTGGAGNDQMLGGIGDDTLNGQGGDDALRGGAGDDVLRGGSGNDRLIGELGNDVIETGGGRDRIVIRPGQGFDRVTDFTDGQDRIVLSGINFGQLSIQQSNDDVLISRGTERLLLLQTTNIGDISAADFA
ncbi:hypothetical protein [Vacuolonema iberomarrocanum]|uniref:hypothetical protein n=1 Tax=Vacuolonema iberomarrocanum TaxID=3454632 RepID=UPI001A0D8004|nr:FG-GAP repeat protein [filamentous cyanobacterium LEGE 07170]